MSLYLRNILKVIGPLIASTVIAWFSSKWGSFKSGQFAFLAGGISTLYFALVTWASKKYPWVATWLGFFHLLATPKKAATSEDGGYAAQGLLIGVVCVLAIIALIIWILPHIH